MSKDPIYTLTFLFIMYIKYFLQFIKDVVTAKYIFTVHSFVLVLSLKLSFSWERFQFVSLWNLDLYLLQWLSHKMTRILLSILEFLPMIVLNFMITSFKYHAKYDIMDYGITYRPAILKVLPPIELVLPRWLILLICIQMCFSITVKPVKAVTSFKQLPVFKGHLLVLL